MQKTPPHLTKTDGAVGGSQLAISVAELEHHINSWIYEGEYRQNTQRTLGQKRDSADKLL